MRQASIIIVNWNTGELLAQCLASIAALPEQSRVRSVVVVDNASVDTSIAQARSIAEKHGYVIILQKHNTGFAKANIAGLSYVQNHGGEQDDILLLNPDTKVQPHTIERMLALFEENNRAGIVGPKLMEQNGEVQPSVRSFPTLPIFLLLFFKLHRMCSRTPLWKRYAQDRFDYEQQASVDQVMGAAFLIRREVIDAIGFLDDAFWIWFEEVDYCKRAKESGWEVVYTPGSSVMHYQGASFHQLVGLKKTKPFLASSLVYAKKHLGAIAYGILLAIYPIAIAIAMFASLAHLVKRHKNKSRL